MASQYYKKWIVSIGILAMILLPQVGKAIGAEEYPAQMIKIIIGYAPGGSMDRQVRLLLPFLQKHLKKGVMVENLTGAQGILAANKVFSSQPDGYTLLFVDSGTIVLQEKYLPETCNFKVRDFAHISSFVRENYLLVTHPEVWKDTAEFFKTAKSKHLRMAISGKGTFGHLYSVMLEKTADVKFNLIPFEGGAQSLAALAGKHVDAVATAISSSLHLIRSGTLYPLLFLSDRRHSALPQTPVPKEIGFTSFDPFESIMGLFGPPKLPADRVKVLEEASSKAVKDPEYVEKAKELSVEIYPMNSRDYFAQTEKEYSQIEKYIDLLKGVSK